MARSAPVGPDTAPIRKIRFNPEKETLRSDANTPKLTQKLFTAQQRIQALEASHRQLFNGDGTTQFDPIFLRDACDCPQCVDPSTGQRNFSSADIPTNIEARPCGQNSDGSWNVAWKTDVPGYDSSHVSKFAANFAKQSALPEPDRLSRTSITFARMGRPLWDKAAFQQKACWMDYDAFIGEESALRSCLSALRRDGLVFITDVPSKSSSVTSIAERIGPLRNSFYGSTWDVRSYPDAKNIAYTDKHLGFHMDLLYMQNPPAYQLLHCLRNSCSGGESRFVDTYKAASILERWHPIEATALRRLKLRFHYTNDGHVYSAYRSVLQAAKPRDLSGNHQRALGDAFDPPGKTPIEYVNWSPPFQAGIDSWQRHNSSTVRALKTFAEILERKDLVYETKLGEGICAIFENRRVAHARNAFKLESGIRWLRGAYVDEDAFWSKVHTVEATGE